MKTKRRDQEGPASNGEDSPDISIVMTAYNAAPFIGASIAAALAQDHPSFEVVVLDDGSSDQTEQICEAIVDPRLRYLRRARIGRATALNEGISIARGKYIAINDADDLSLPHRLNYTLDFFRTHHDVAFVATAYLETSVFCQTTLEGAVLHDKATTISPVWIPPGRLYRSNPFVHSTVVFPKSTWKSVGGYDQTLGMCYDYDFFLRALQFGRVALLPGQTVQWYTNPSSFFKEKSRQEYFDTLSFIKRRVRRQMNFPIWVRIYDALMMYRRLVGDPS